MEFIPPDKIKPEDFNKNCFQHISEKLNEANACMVLVIGSSPPVTGQNNFMVVTPPGVGMEMALQLLEKATLQLLDEFPPKNDNEDARKHNKRALTKWGNAMTEDNAKAFLVVGQDRKGIISQLVSNTVSERELIKLFREWADQLEKKQKKVS